MEEFFFLLHNEIKQKFRLKRNKTERERERGGKLPGTVMVLFKEASPPIYTGGKLPNIITVPRNALFKEASPPTYTGGKLPQTSTLPRRDLFKMAT